MILALDTATDFPSFALGTPADPGADLRPADRRDLSREIERFVAALLAGRGVAPGDLAAVVVADGPGTFTGLRIGAAFAKGLCRAVGIPLLAAPSLAGAAAARAVGEAGTVEVEARYDALRGESYRAVYRVGPGGVEAVAAAALVPQAAAWNALRADEHHASAAALLALVGRAGGPAPVADPARWEPVYGRLAEAEARRNAASGGAP